MLSLRTRVILGAVFWTVGLILVGSFLLVTAIEFHSNVRRFIGIHDVFRSPIAIAAAVGCLIAGVWHVRRGIAGISALRTRLGAVHEGREARVEGRHVPEVQPLIDDLNSLLEHREQAVRRAVARAGDLAHGLKTPLALLAREAERVGAAGHSELASAISEQVERMRRQIDYHLAHARAAASGALPGARCAIRESADGLARTLLRLHADRCLSIDVRVDPSHTARVRREDLDEMLGNLLDNACKWTRTQIVLESAAVERGVMITVDDDGPGLPEAMREIVLGRGVRADEKASGSGLGLAIVRDLAALHQGAISLGESPLGGLRATLTLPRG